MYTTLFAIIDKQNKIIQSPVFFTEHEADVYLQTTGMDLDYIKIKEFK